MNNELIDQALSDLFGGTADEAEEKEEEKVEEKEEERVEEKESEGGDKEEGEVRDEVRDKVKEKEEDKGEDKAGDKPKSIALAVQQHAIEIDAKLSHSIDNMPEAESSELLKIDHPPRSEESSSSESSSDTSSDEATHYGKLMAKGADFRIYHAGYSDDDADAAPEEVTPISYHGGKYKDRLIDDDGILVFGGAKGSKSSKPKSSKLKSSKLKSSKPKGSKSKESELKSKESESKSKTPPTSPKSPIKKEESGESQAKFAHEIQQLMLRFTSKITLA